MSAQEDPQNPSKEQALSPATQTTPTAAAAEPPSPSLTPEQALQREKKVVSKITYFPQTFHHRTHQGPNITISTSTANPNRQSNGPKHPNHHPNHRTPDHAGETRAIHSGQVFPPPASLIPSLLQLLKIQRANGTPARTPKPTPQSIVQRHIRLLHEYNEIKDIAQGLMGMIADGRGVRHIEVQREFGVGGDD